MAKSIRLISFSESFVEVESEQNQRFVVRTEVDFSTAHARGEIFSSATREKLTGDWP